MSARWAASVKDWPPKHRPHALDLILMFACPAFSFEVSGDPVCGTVLPISIGGIDIICRDVGDLTKECAAVPD